jgi:collagenase-like PrtC family protease
LIESESDLKALRKIAANSDYLVEANDMGAVHLLAGKAPFVAGPHLNIYNPHTLALLAKLGARRWVMPVELSRDSLRALQQQRPASMTTEVFGYGRLPLALSARCFTARRYNLSKDNCEFRCIDHPDGMPLATREGQPFLALNGIQTQSAQTYNLVRELAELAQLGVDVLRISPQSMDTVTIVELFRQCLDQTITPDAAARRMESLMPVAACNGYWHGQPGLAQVNASGTSIGA